MKRLFFYIILLLHALCFLGYFAHPCQSQPFLEGSRAAALAGSIVALPGESWGIYNPASPASVRHTHFSLFAGQGYGLQELRFGAVHFFAPFPFAAITLQARTFGADKYQEQRYQAGLAKSFYLGTSRPFHIGFAFFVHRTSIQEYGQSSVLGSNVGLLVEIWHQLYLGVQAENLLQGGRSISLPEYLRLGLGYQILQTTWLLIAAEKTMHFPVSLKAGFEHGIGKAWTIRTGMATRPFRFTLGTETKLSIVSIGIALEKHFLLGWTPAISVDYQGF